MTYSGATTDEIIGDLNQFYDDPSIVEDIFDAMRVDNDLFTGSKFNDEGTQIKLAGAAVEYLNDYIEDEGEDPFIDEFEPTEVSTNRTKIIGGKYNGINDIKEKTVTVGYTSETLVYIPKSTDCIIHVYDKYFELIGKNKVQTLYEFINDNRNKMKLNVGGITTRKLTEVLKKYGEEKIPTYRVWIDRDAKNKKIIKYSREMNKCDISKFKYCIGLIFLGNGVYHAILIKGNTIKNSIEKYGLKPEHLTIQFEKRTDIVIETKICPKPKIKSPKKYCVVYDIETYTNEKNKLIPITLGWGIVDLEKEDYEKCLVNYEVLSEYEDWTKLYLRMLKKSHELAESLNYKDDLLFYAHNGSKFDNLYVRHVKELKFSMPIKSGNQFKSITAELQSVKRKFIFRDTLPFTLGSLKRSCEIFDVPIPKIDFDIIGKSKEWFKENQIEHHKTLNNPIIESKTGIKDDDIKLKESESHIVYLKYDVISLAILTWKVNKMFGDLGMSITNFVGLPGMSYHLLRRSCIGMEDLRIPRHPTLAKFIKESIYGGRVLQWKTIFPPRCVKLLKKHGKVLIAIDLNSLYPSAMYMAGFPIGNPFLLKEEHLNLNYLLNGGPKHFIIECEIKIPNIQYPLHPFKKYIRNKDGDVSSCYLTYPSNQTITGVYNDVDLKEMIKDGYTITKVIKGIAWMRSARIFSDLIEFLYNKRAEYKKKAKSEDVKERNESKKEYIYKILLNAMYGKFNETIREVTKYCEDYTEKAGTKLYRSNKLPNGQEECMINNLYPEFNKPTQIASYILSYSRAIANEIFRVVGPENVYYSDTDSLYIPKKIYDKCYKEFGNKIDSTELCGFKNDYGDNVFITKAIFLDLKRYYLEKKCGDNYSYTFKFNGLNFRNVNMWSTLFNSEIYDKDNKAMLDYEKLATKLYNDYYVEKLRNFNYDLDDKGIELFISCLKKSSTDITAENSKKIFNIDPTKRGTWIIDENDNEHYTALGFDPLLPDYSLLKREKENKKHRCGELQDHENKYKKKIKYKISNVINKQSKPSLFTCVGYDNPSWKEEIKDWNVLHAKSYFPLIVNYESLSKSNKTKFEKQKNGIYKIVGKTMSEDIKDGKYLVTNFYVLGNKIYFRETVRENNHNHQDEIKLYEYNGFSTSKIVNLSKEQLKNIKPLAYILVKGEEFIKEAKDIYGYNILDNSEYSLIAKCYEKYKSGNIEKTFVSDSQVLSKITKNYDNFIRTYPHAKVEEYRLTYEITTLTVQYYKKYLEKYKNKNQNIQKLSKSYLEEGLEESRLIQHIYKSNETVIKIIKNIIFLRDNDFMDLETYNYKLKNIIYPLFSFPLFSIAQTGFFYDLCEFGEEDPCKNSKEERLEEIYLENLNSQGLNLLEKIYEEKSFNYEDYLKTVKLYYGKKIL